MLSSSARVSQVTYQTVVGVRYPLSRISRANVGWLEIWQICLTGGTLERRVVASVLGCSPGADTKLG